MTADRVRLNGSHPAHLPGATAAADVHPESVYQATVVLQPAALPAAHPVARKAQRHASAWPTDRPAFSRAELDALLAPPASMVDQVTTFAREHGLVVRDVSAVRHDVVLEGTAESLQRAFRVVLRHYEHAGGRYHGHDGPVSVPPHWEDAIEGILGLDHVPAARAHVAPGGAESTPFEPAELATHYRFPDVPVAARPRVALLEFGGGLDPDDLRTYLQERGITPGPLRVVTVTDGAGTRCADQPMETSRVRAILAAWRAGTPLAELGLTYGPALTDFMDTVEVTMDAELVAGLAPGVALDLVFAPGHADGWRRAVYAALGVPYAGSVSTPVCTWEERPAVVSISWGAAEQSWGTAKLRALHRAFEFAAWSDVTLCCSTGDFGSRDSPRPVEGYNAHFPASSPAVLACGGTALVSGGTESAWKESVLGVVMASGGGMSGCFPRPGFQEGLATPASDGTWLAASGRFDGRWTPDVAALAGFSPGVAMRLAGMPFTGGGTSAATPIWAALVARLGSALGRRLGVLAPALYGLAGTPALRPVAGADNDLDLGTGTPRYAARGRWNPCAGLGVPDGTALLEALSAGPSRPG